MANPYLKFNGKTVRVGSGGGRLISPFEPIPEDTLRFEFLDGYDPTNPPEGSAYADYQTAKGSWSHVYGNVYDWTCHDPKWYVVGYNQSHQGPYFFSALASTPVSNPGSYYMDTTGNPLATEPFRIIGGNTSNITHMPSLFYKIGNRCTEVGWFDTHNVVNAARMFGWQSSNGMHVGATLPDFDFSGITNDELTDEGISPSDKQNFVGLYQWCYNNKSITVVPSITFPSNRAIRTKNMFNGCKSLASANIVGLNSSDAEGMFSKTVISAPSFTNCTLNNPKLLFGSASSNVSYPVTVTMSNVALTGDAAAMFSGCTALTAIPSFDTSGLTSLLYAFRNCYNVESGALALYQQASAQTTPPSNHNGTFTNCGRDTVTGAAELAQIPTDWGGTYTPPSE